ncbi:cupin domain-containing protein [Turneriella parva]|uniref:Cupin 2 conserved barrel domain protein n=1 Tax=Turneriella parva (strain ATCC BAA-1111 / DSM 21527 / NCTC 11395 / H) TaxID=869212 RepID=I4B2M4_TURPD|nr:cupin domain-containing protein [Turneriella parva]AFM11531.1 Cupin 2 conserved barrel domain protein [Turneriella parva DSM 21527]
MKNWQHRILDAVTQGREPAWRDRLFRHRRAYAAEIERLATALCYGAEAVTPFHSLKERTLAAVAECEEQQVMPATTRNWKYLLPGIEICVLSEKQGHRSVLLRIKAGHTLPSHDHKTTEQAMVLEGSCYSGKSRLEKGDFFIADAGTRHEPVSAIEDCVLLVIAHP